MIRDRWWALINPAGVTIDSHHDRKAMDAYRTRHIEYFPCTVEELCIVKVSDLEKLQADFTAARQALWDVYEALGFDTDGDATPAAVVGLNEMVVRAAEEVRRDGC